MSLSDNQITRHKNTACVIVAPRQSSPRRDRQNGHPDCRSFPIQIVALHATLRYLTLDECKRLQGAVDEDFQKLVKGALLTGCRYGSLRFLRVADVDLAARSGVVRVTKNGKPQTIRFTARGCAFVKLMIKGKAKEDLIFTKASGAPWKPSDQKRRMQDGCEAAGIDPPIGFHGLRDTFASHLVMSGVPLLTVSKLLGHADTRTTEKYYAHLAPDHLHKAIDDHLPDF